MGFFSKKRKEDPLMVYPDPQYAPRDVLSDFHAQQPSPSYAVPQAAILQQPQPVQAPLAETPLPLQSEQVPQVTMAPEKPVTVQPTAYEPTPSAPTRLLSYHSANLQGIGARSEQQDGFGFVNSIDVRKMREKGLLAIVADGMGGMSGGKLASELTVDSIRASFNRFDYEQDLSAQLVDSIRTASSAVNEQLHGEGGSTAIVCLFYDAKLRFASAGDSYLFLLRGGTLYQINRLHTMFSLECEKHILRDDIDPSEAYANPEKNAVASFVGMDDISDIDCFVKPFKLCEGDVIMLCSDGVAGVLDNGEMADCLSAPTPQMMCDYLERYILNKAKKYQDNYTALVIRCEY